MKKKVYMFLLMMACIGLFSNTGYAQKKLAQTGFQFLSVGLDARATAMGEAVTAAENSSSAQFYNPATMATMSREIEVSLGQTQWIADVTYYSASLAYRPANGLFGVFGVSFLSVNYGDFLGTAVSENEQGYVDTGTFSPTASAIGIGYAKALSDRFSVGGNIKYATQSFGERLAPSLSDPNISKLQEVSTGVVAFDFGTKYNTGFKSLAFGISLRNFSQEISYVDESFVLPLTFRIGFSMNALDFFQADSDRQSLLVTVDALNNRSYPEHIRMGVEYTLLNTFALRGGYSFQQPGDDILGFSAGFGIQMFGLGVNYSYTPFDTFSDVHRFTVNMGI